MAYQILINNDDDFRWLQVLIENQLERARAGKGNLEVGLMAERLSKDFATAEKVGKLPDLTPAEPSEKPKGKRRSSAQVAEEDWIPNHCPTHPKYGAIRAPRNDCEECWKAYERLQPLNAEKYKRSQKYKRTHK